jgi:hypothetical protein
MSQKSRRRPARLKASPILNEVIERLASRGPESHSVDAKASDTLLHFVDPLIDDEMRRDVDAFGALLRVGIVIWNLGAFQMPEWKGKEVVPGDPHELLRDLAAHPKAPVDLLFVAEAMLQRRRTIFGNDRRMIVDAQITPDPQVGYRLRCQSTLPEHMP